MKIKIDQKMSDEDIVEYVRTTDKESFSHIIDRYETRIMMYIKRLTNNSSESEDLTQQTLVNVYKNLNSFKLDNKFSSWIYRIAHNITINWLKKKKADVYLDDDSSYLQIASKLNIENDFTNTEAGIEINKALNKLPKKQKEPFILKYIEDKSYEEISYILRMPKNTVGTHIARAKKSLKKELEKYVR